MKHTILIVDDVELNLEFLEKFLQEKYNIICAKNGNEAIEIACTKQIDLILLDVIMPKINGFEVCAVLKSDLKTKQIPIIFVTSKIDEDSIIQGYEMGAVDYVTKPYKRLELLAKIKTHLKLKSLIDNLIYIATHDTMTGILNRGEFFRLSKKRFQDNKENLFAIMMDIDNFKLINDTYGHQIGDKVIKEFTKIIKGYLNKETIFGRVGGEEFALVCNYSNNIQEKIEIMRNAVEQTCVLIPNKEIKFTVSIGITNYSIEDNNIDDLLKYADKNLYEAKKNGKNRVVFKER